MMTGAAFGTALALKSTLVRSKQAGTIKFFGAPAEEEYVAKVFMARDGVFDGLDAMLAWHPSGSWAANSDFNALISVKFRFYPTQGRYPGLAPRTRGNPIVATTRLAGEVDGVRQRLFDENQATADYVMTLGGDVPTATPDVSEIWFMLVAPDRPRVAALHERIQKQAHAIAAATDTRLEEEFLLGTHERLRNEALTALVARYLPTFMPASYSDAEMGAVRNAMKIVPDAPEKLFTFDAHTNDRSNGSADRGDVSWLTPMTHVHSHSWPAGAPRHSACTGDGRTHVDRAQDNAGRVPHDDSGRGGSDDTACGTGQGAGGVRVPNQGVHVSCAAERRREAPDRRTALGAHDVLAPASGQDAARLTRCVFPFVGIGGSMDRVYVRGASFVAGVAIVAGLALRVSSQSPAPTTLVLQGGTIIDVQRGTLSRDSVVVIEDGRIKAVGAAGSVAVPAGAQVVNAAGKFIMPGLWDSHAHTRDFDGALNINHGVTSTMDMGNILDWILVLQEAREKALSFGPRVYPQGMSIGGRLGPHQWNVKTVEEARQAARENIQAGVNFLKVYQDATLDMIRAVSEEADKAGLNVNSHLRQTDAREAILAGVDALAHGGGIAAATSQPDVAKRVRSGELRDEIGQTATSANYLQDPALFDDLIKLMIQRNVRLEPNIVQLYRGIYDQWDAYQLENHRLSMNPNLHYIPEMFVEMWATDFNFDPYPPMPELYKKLHKGLENHQLFIRKFAAAGGKLLVGTDNYYHCVAGLAVWQEMELMAAAGVQPLQVLCRPPLFIRPSSSTGRRSLVRSSQASLPTSSCSAATRSRTSGTSARSRRSSSTGRSRSWGTGAITGTRSRGRTSA